MAEHEDDDLTLVYTGSNLNANYIKNMLEENGIGAMVRNTLRESLAAGWVSGAPEDSSRVFVAEYHKEEAEALINDYLDSLDDPDEK